MQRQTWEKNQCMCMDSLEHLPTLAEVSQTLVGTAGIFDKELLSSESNMLEGVLRNIYFGKIMGKCTTAYLYMFIKTQYAYIFLYL